MSPLLPLWSFYDLNAVRSYRGALWCGLDQLCGKLCVNLRWNFHHPQRSTASPGGDFKESFLLNQDKFLQESLPGSISSVVKKCQKALHLASFGNTWLGVNLCFRTLAFAVPNFSINSLRRQYPAESFSPCEIQCKIHSPSIRCIWKQCLNLTAYGRLDMCGAGWGMEVLFASNLRVKYVG